MLKSSRMLVAFAALSSASILAAEGKPGGTKATATARVRRLDPEDVFAECVHKGLPEDGVLLLVSIARQNMAIVRAGKLAATIPVSTSRNGVGNRYGSCKTPPGLHRVVERIGDREPLGRIFVGRVATDRICPESEWQTDATEDLVLTRILRLQGLEQGVNRGPGVDSYNRCIYIHGTNEEHLLGTPASHGCIRISNNRVAALYGLIKGRETWCDIVDG